MNMEDSNTMSKTKKQPFIICQIRKSEVLLVNISRHIEEEHCGLRQQAFDRASTHILTETIKPASDAHTLPETKARVMVTCEFCGSPVRQDRLIQHIQKVHPSGHQQRVEGKTNSMTSTVPQPKSTKKVKRGNFRFCDYCSTYIPTYEWLEHIRSCRKKNESIDHPIPVTLTNRLYPFCKTYVPKSGDQQPSKSRIEETISQSPRPTYVIDEFGVVHDYKEWIKNETLADGNNDHTPVVTSQISARSQYTLPSSTKTDRRIPNRKSGESTPSKTKTQHQHVVINKQKPSLESKELPKRLPKQVMCKKCLTFVNDQDSFEHICSSERLISVTSAQELYIACPVCQTQVIGKYLHIHLDLKHHEINYFEIQKKTPKKAQSNKKVKGKGKNKGKKKTSGGSAEWISDQDQAKLESFLQSFDEKRDGGKYLGHMRRESSGQFGSLPLFDDYDDDANAD